MKNHFSITFIILLLAGILSSFSTEEIADKNTGLSNTNISNEDSGENPGRTLLSSLKNKVATYRKRRDTFGYTHGAIGTAFVDISGTGTNTGITGDDTQANFTMPFEFDLYGTVSQNLRIGDNGAILFDATTGTINATNVTFPNSDNPLMIAPYWDDLVPSAGDIFYETQGTAPNRSFIVQWENVDAYPTGGGNGTFEVILYEGTNNIDFVYQDTNFNGSDNDGGESATIGINRNISDAELNSFDTDDNSADSGDAIRFTHPDNAVGMSFTSSTTSQPSSGIGVDAGSTQQEIIRMEIVVDGNSGPLSAANFDFNTTGTTDADNDIQNARVYYTGTSPDFATDIQFGAITLSPNGVFSIASAQTLVNGTNYFWLAYDIQGGATDNNFVDAECTALTVGGIRTPTVTAPAGNREIGGPNGLDCSGAYNITPVCGTTVTVNGTTVGGDTSTNADCTTDGNDDAKIWYTFVGNGASVTATTIDISSVLNDTKIWVYSGSCAGLVCVDGNDDASGFYSSVTFTADVGTTYYIVVGEFPGTSDGLYQLDVTFDAAMTYTSSITTQNSASTIQSATDEQIIGVEVVMGNNCDPLDLTSLTFNTTGSTDATNDLDNARVFYTGTSSTFTTATQVGATQASPDGVFTVTGFTQTLSVGTNYFWLAYDIAASATDNNVVDAECTSITVDGVAQNPSVTAPSGSRTINPDITVLRGSQLDFDGGDQVVATGYTGITGSNNRTIEMWIRSNENATRTLIHWGTNNANGQRWRIRKQNSGGTGLLQVDIRNQTISTTQLGDFIDVDDGSWHHIAIVLDGTMLDDINFYVDGMLQDKGANATVVNTVANTNVTIGSTTGGANNYTGEMDEVRLWSVARAENEIRENMHITLAGDETNLEAYWQFNELSGSSFADVTANGRTLTGGGGTADPTIEESTVAVAGGVSDLQNVSSTGAVSFSGTDLSMNFTVAPSTASDFIVYKLTGEDAPGNDPLTDGLGLVTVTPSYWVVRHFSDPGSPITFTTNVTFTLGSSTVSADDAAAPANLELISRSSNSFGAWSSVGNANTAVEETGVITFNGVTTFSQLKVGTASNSPLPITLKSFDGYTENKNHHLEWVTSSEINNDYFELERSADGINFEVIAEINGAGTTSEEQAYEYLDSDPFFGQNYYRLRQIDIDGKSAYADRIVLLENNSSTLEKLSYQLYPNPTTRANINVNISSPDIDRDIHITLFDLYGRRYSYKKLTANELNSEVFISPEYEMPSGIYLMIVQQGDQKVQKKLIIE